jgi:UDP-3-O-[3-hydroxymyristoyl] glucosamine N-acyltransferase
MTSSSGPLALGEIASRLGGRVAGNPGTLIRQVGSLEGARADEITFFSHARYKAQLAATHAGAVILSAEHESMTSLPRIVCDAPYAYFARVSQLFNPILSQPPGVHPAASVAPSAKIGARVSVGAGCVIGERVTIADDTCLYPRVVIYAGCTIGARCILHSGVVIGADGFGMAKEAHRWIKIPQIGIVRIGDEVEIGANTTIDRGTLEDTVIEDGVKLDNQIQIGHNVRIGANTAIAGCTGVAGSTHIGRNCIIAGAARIIGHLTIADGVEISVATVITRSIHKPGTYTGVFPFDDHASWARNTALVRRLTELHERLRALEKEKKNG